MAFKFQHPAINRKFQVVDASERGDQCYENRKGWHWHFMDSDHGIDVSTIHGPFEEYAEAYDDAYYYRPRTN